MRLLAIPLTILVIAVTVHILYGQSAKHQRLPEDRTAVWSNEAVTGDRVGGALMGHFHDSSRDGWHGSIRPVPTIALRTHFGWFHQIRTGYQRMQIVWMTLTCILAMWLFHGAQRSQWLGAAGGLLFTVHPLATGSVLNISGISELLALSFLAGSFLFLQPLSIKLKDSLRRNPSGRGADVSYVGPMAASGVCLLLALWSHELAVAGLPVLLVWIWTVVRSGQFGQTQLGSPDNVPGTGQSVRAVVEVPAARAATLTVVGAFALFALHRLIVYGLLPDHLKNGHAVLTTTGIEWLRRAWLGLQAGPTVLEQVFIPIRLGYVNDHLIVAGPGIAGAIVGIALLTGLAALMTVGVRRGQAGLALWSAWALFFLVGAMGLVSNQGDIAPVRLVFMSLPGFVGLALIAVDGLMRRYRGPSTKWAVIALSVAVWIMLGTRTYSRVDDFEGEETLISSQLRDYPMSARGHFDKGNMYLARGQWSAAQTEYEAALALRPEFAMAWSNLGNAYFSQNEYGLAMRSYLFALSETKGRPEFAVVEARAEYHRGLILMQQNRNEEAVAALKKMIEIFPDHLPSHANLGLIYANAPAYEAEARHHLNRALSLETDQSRRKTLEDFLRLIEERRGRIGEESQPPPNGDWGDGDD